MGIEALIRNMFGGGLGSCAESGPEALARRMQALSGLYNVEINTPISHCPECPHCKKIKREATLETLKITQQILDKKVKYKKRCVDWVEKIRKLTWLKKEGS